jgi:pyruvate/2-oxoglutarate dehydrogenase complex dihydrolipoamide acyltransferase (E2) component
MPPLGETTDELRIVEWLKVEGDDVALGESLFEVETDKVTLAVEATVRGTLLEILHREGESVRVGTVIAYVGEPGEKVPDQMPILRPAPEAVAGGEPPTSSPQRAGVSASPAVRRLAQDLGVDLSRVRGSGPDGRIEREDVLEMAESPTDES